ncbi:ABC transporter permease [Sulfitobacter sp. F26169L]|uniref:ABC transporter permease n=1 Tax=Sulfitobacter sp. F26169L TaxID=2996015 RepID=UPI002261037F|nr:ABC transporter permease [Sulfitobacter sp. F26169L]MCX7564984.1 ABC transporter permease [Sulfitobacter sp. F26169L]
MISLRLFLSEVTAALRTLLGDPNARMTMIAGILIYSVLYPQPFVGEVVRDVPIVAIDQDNSAASRSFLRRIDASDQVEIVSAMPNMDAARDAFFRREAYGIVIIPAGFEKDILAQVPAPIAAFGDGSYLLVYSNIMEAVTTVARAVGAEVNFERLTATGMDDVQARASLSPVSVTNIKVFNPQGGYASYVVPASFVLILQQTLMMGIGLLHAGRRMPTGLRMWATPVAYIGLYVVWVAFTQLLLPLFYGIPRTGDFSTLLLVALPFICACTAMGFAIALLIPWREGVVFFLVVMGLPLFFLSGIAWPIESIPQHLHILSLLVPSSSAISAFVAVNQMGASPQDIAGTVQLQIILAIGYTALAVAIYQLSSPPRQQAGK